MFGLTFFERARHNGQLSGVTIVSRHPRTSLTWYWSLSVKRVREGENRTPFRYFPPFRKMGQWHHRLNLIGGWYLLIGRQDYHRKQPLSATAKGGE